MNFTGLIFLQTLGPVVNNMIDISAASVLLLVLLIYILSKAASFTKNYTAAVRTGYPVWISPVFSHSIPWMILGPMFRPQMERYMPEWIYNRLVMFCAGWEFHAGVKMHKMLGKIFVAVTPDECTLWSVPNF